MRFGFLMSFEATTSLILLIFAVSTLQLYQLPQKSPNDFFACSDAALLLSKADAFSGASLQEKVDALSDLSGLCIEAKSDSVYSSSCKEDAAKERTAFNMAIWKGGGVQQASVSCWRGD